MDALLAARVYPEIETTRVEYVGDAGQIGLSAYAVIISPIQVGLAGKCNLAGNQAGVDAAVITSAILFHCEPRQPP